MRKDPMTRREALKQKDVDTFLRENHQNLEVEMHQRLMKAIQLAQDAGEIIRSLFRAEQEQYAKEGQDFAVEADLKAEKLILDGLRDQFPTDTYLSEEAGASQEKESAFRWIIDPLDGTANFKAGIEYFCVPLALEQDGQVVFSVVYNPNNGDLYYAVKDQGAFLNGERISVSQTASIEKFLVSYSTSNHKNEKAKEQGAAAFAAALNHCRAVRLQGSSILDLCLLAEGSFDGLLKVQASYWDVAAGALMVREAGGTVTDWLGNDYSENSEDVVASNGMNHEQFQRVITA